MRPEALAVCFPMSISTQVHSTFFAGFPSARSAPSRLHQTALYSGQPRRSPEGATVPRYSLDGAYLVAINASIDGNNRRPARLLYTAFE